MYERVFLVGINNSQLNITWKELYFRMINVNKNYHRKGIGSFLVEQAKYLSFLDKDVSFIKLLDTATDENNNKKIENFYEQFGFKKFEQLSSHKSDLVRSVACYLLAKQPFSFEDKLKLMTRLAEDQNSGVREWAWLAVRKEFAQDLIKNISYLVCFTNQSTNLRRFVCELSRPRGVWCRHILEFRESPWLGLEIIEPLKSDEAKYVQLSVGNWLNDASKTQSNWVKELCFKWQQESPTKHTHAICKRALRTIHKEKISRPL